MVIGKGEVRGAVTPESGMSHRGGRRRVLHGAERLEHEAADAHQRADLGGAAGELPEHARDGGAACAPLRTARDGGRAGLGASARLRRRRAAGEGRRRPPLQRRARHRLLQACTGFSSEIGTKLRDWAIVQAGGGSCYSRAAFPVNPIY